MPLKGKFMRRGQTGELNENIEKLTKLLTNMKMAGAERRMGHRKVFFLVVKLGIL